MTNKKNIGWPCAVLAAALLLASAGCSHDHSVAAPSAGGTSGTDRVLQNPNASPALKAQAAQQQQMAQQQAQALRQAQAHSQPAGQPTKP